MPGVSFGERQNNTPEQVDQYIRDALFLVVNLDPPDDLREAAFNHAVQLFSAKQIIAEQTPPLMAIPRGQPH